MKALIINKPIDFYSNLGIVVFTVNTLDDKEVDVISIDYKNMFNDLLEVEYKIKNIFNF